MVIGSLRSLKCVKPNYRGVWKVLVVGFKKWKVLGNYTTNQINFQIIGREGQNLARNIKESIYIRVNNPSLNNNIGKFNLSHIWDRVLLNTNGLSLK